MPSPPHGWHRRQGERFAEREGPPQRARQGIGHMHKRMPLKQQRQDDVGESVAVGDRDHSEVRRRNVEPHGGFDVGCISGQLLSREHHETRLASAAGRLFEMNDPRRQRAGLRYLRCFPLHGTEHSAVPPCAKGLENEGRYALSNTRRMDFTRSKRRQVVQLALEVSKGLTPSRGSIQHRRGITAGGENLLPLLKQHALCVACGSSRGKLGPAKRLN